MPKIQTTRAFGREKPAVARRRDPRGGHTHQYTVRIAIFVDSSAFYGVQKAFEDVERMNLAAEDRADFFGGPVHSARTQRCIEGCRGTAHKTYWMKKTYDGISASKVSKIAI